jgi:CxxC motif-containing protein
MAVETRIMNCIMCPLGCEMTVTVEDGAVTDVKGNTCPRGAQYAKDEVTAPKRMLTSTVAIAAVTARCICCCTSERKNS